ncbi:MAG: hypothetical protein WB710_02300 [Stellaceae bacterium]
MTGKIARARPRGLGEIGFGAQASPCGGYVPMNLDRREPGEPAEAKPGHEAGAP